MSSAAVAVVLGAAELVWLGQRQKHRQLGFLFGERPVRSCISWKRYVDDVVVGGRVFCYSCIFSACLIRGTNLVGIGSRYGCPHVGGCGIARRRAARGGQHQESESIVGARSGSAAKVDYSSLDWFS